MTSLFSPPPAIVNLHRLDTDNVGDLASSPALYLDFLRDVPRHDLLRVSKRVARGARLVLFGGGGLLDNDYFRQAWDDVLAASTAEMIGWGLGHNRHGMPRGTYPLFLERFSLLGVRDWDLGRVAPVEWVPCASCLHEEFSAPHAITTDVVCYEHARHPLRLDGVATMRNNGRDAVTAIRFLASAETVVTNTYHGMYWATLLGRKAIVLPYSSKFHGFRYPVAMSTPDKWRSARSSAAGFPEALDECRQANLRFADKVRERVSAAAAAPARSS